MIESLLIMGCIFGNSTGCVTAGQAYYQTTELPAIVSKIEKEQVEAVYIVTTMSTVIERKATFGIGYNFVASLDFTSGSGAPFLKWTKGF